jgi:hypothetical protein
VLSLVAAAAAQDVIPLYAGSAPGSTPANYPETDVAKYLAAKGVTAFVLKYRVAHTGDDATKEFGPLYADRQKFDETMKNVEPLAVADGLAAVTYVRQHASEWGPL